MTESAAKAVLDRLAEVAVPIAYGWTSVSAAGSVVWVATDATFEVKAGGEEMALPARMTFVLVRRGDEWPVVQGRFSSPTPAQDEGESFPT